MIHGLAWDKGVHLRRREEDLGAYSNSIVVGSLNPHGRNRLLIRVPHAHEKNKTNVLHWWLETRSGQTH